MSRATRFRGSVSSSRRRQSRSRHARSHRSPTASSFRRIGKNVYVADNNPRETPIARVRRRSRRTLADKKVLFDFVTGRGIDGMTLDSDGNIYATAGTGDKAGIYVFTPSGKHLAFIATPGDPTNCVLGGGADSRNSLHYGCHQGLRPWSQVRIVPDQAEGRGVSCGDAGKVVSPAARLNKSSALPRPKHRSPNSDREREYHQRQNRESLVAEKDSIPTHENCPEYQERN